MTVRHSPLHAEHIDLGARLVDFGGWEMPLAYPQGTIAEHLACRNDAAVFDASHLGTVRVESRGSLALLQTSLTNDLRRIGPGRAQYQHLLDEADASVLDDIIVWWGDFDGEVLLFTPREPNQLKQTDESDVEEGECHAPSSSSVSRQQKSRSMGPDDVFGMHTFGDWPGWVLQRTRSDRPS